MEFKLNSINTIALRSLTAIALAIPYNAFAQEPAATQPTTPTTTTASTASDEKICGDKPACEITVKTGMEFLNYLKVCNTLEGATIRWKASSSIDIAMKADKESYCSLNVYNSLIENNPTTTKCTLNRDQIAGMTTPLAVEAVESYQKSPLNVDKLMGVMKPLVDCLGPLPTKESVDKRPAKTTSQAEPVTTQ